MAAVLAVDQAPASKSWVWPVVWAVLLSTLALGQLMIGTDPAFTGLVVVFSAIWLVSVKLLGGPFTLMGACIGFAGLQHILISQFAKLFMGQRPDAPLQQPIVTMQVYVLGMLGILLAAILTRGKYLQGIKPVLSPEIREDRLRVLAYAMTFMMVIRYFGMSGIVPQARVLLQFDFVVPLAVACATAYTVVYSNRQKCLSPLTLFGVAVPLLFGIAFSQRRESSYALVIFVITAIAFGYKFKLWQIVGGALVGAFFVYIIFPFALVARNTTRTASLTQSLSQSWEVLGDAISNPGKFQEEAARAPSLEDAAAWRVLYYGRPNPNLDRMSIIITTDSLVQATITRGTVGWETIVPGFEMVIPRAFNPDKEPVGTSNSIAQKAPGVVNDLDFVTSITLGFFLESFLAFGWLGAFGLPFLMCLCYFVVYRIVMRQELRQNIWACGMVVFLPWTFSEGTFQQNIVQVFQNGPLMAFVGLVIMVAVNSMSRSRNLQAERVEDLPREWKPVNAQ